jgi:iron only hydrogenase large subunit-like protein
VNVLNPIFTEKAACQDCYKCLRECAVKAIKVEGGRAAVVPELCVLCGHCVEICPAGAKKVRDDLGRAQLLAAAGGAIASLAPSFVSEFPGVEPARLVAAIRALGFMAVSETARGADLVARQVALDLRDALRHDDAASTATAYPPGQVFISSACPTVVEYLKKYRPALGSRVTAMYSPLLAHASELRDAKRSGDAMRSGDAKRSGDPAAHGDATPRTSASAAVPAVVFIGPCISKKREADLFSDLVDVAIDFSDLRRWMAERGIDPAAMSPGPDDRFWPERAAKGALYPMDGGMIAAVKRYPIPESASFMAFSGIEEIDRALAGLDDAAFAGPVFLELLACPGGCLNGPRVSGRTGTIAKRLAVQAYADGARDRTEAESRSLDLAWEPQPIEEPKPDPVALAAVLKATGKQGPDDELNCGGCGYDACRDFAAAVLAGKAERDMCVSYMRSLAQKKANGLIAAMPSGVVIVDKDLIIVECNENFAKLLGEEAERLWEAKPGLAGAELQKLLPFGRYFMDALAGAPPLDKDLRLGRRILHAKIFGIEAGSYAGGVIQDVTAPWVRKDRVVSQARKVISKNLAVVQKIAYLLGENAAETEATLSSIIESFDEGEEGDER